MIYTIEDIFDNLNEEVVRDKLKHLRKEISSLKTVTDDIKRNMDDYLIYNKLPETVTNIEKKNLYDQFSKNIKINKGIEELDDNDIERLQIASGYNYKYNLKKLKNDSNYEAILVKRISNNEEIINRARERVIDNQNREINIENDIYDLEKLMKKASDEEKGLLEFKILRKENELHDYKIKTKSSIRELRTVDPNILTLNLLDFNNENKEKIKEFILEHNYSFNPIRVVINTFDLHNNYVYDEKTLEVIDEIKVFMDDNVEKGEMFFKEKEGYLSDYDLKYVWDYKEVINANKRINDEVADIKKIIDEKGLTPFETMLYIHNFVTSRYAYKENIDNDDFGRNLISVYRNSDIVCTGYTTYIKAIVDKLNMPGLKCELIGSSIYDSKFKWNQAHILNLIEIDDDKYDIHGRYLEDACLDAKEHDNKSNNGFGHCLYPIEDSNYYRDGTFIAFETNEYIYPNISYNVIHEDNASEYNANIKYNRLSNEERLGKSGNAISYEKYKAALNNLFDEKYVKKVLINSVYDATKGFTKGCSSEFYIKNRKDKDSIMQYITLVKRDIVNASKSLRDILIEISKTPIIRK